MKLLLLGIALAITPASYPQNGLNAVPSRSSQPIGKYVHVLADPGGLMKMQDAFSNEHYSTPNADVPNLGSSSGAY